MNNGCEKDSCCTVECQEACNSKNVDVNEPKSNDLIEKTNELNAIKKVIGVVSGKGGVGKSLVTSMLSVLMRRKGYNVGIMDADITGPSIPKAFGVTKKMETSELGIFCEKTKNSIKLASINLLIKNEDDPVIWRGPIIAGAVKQFWTDVIWGELDYLFIDMPPGTGDVPLTAFQSIPIDGIIIVTSPQDLVSMVVKKAFKMAKMMNIPVLGMVENMSYIKCPDCDKKISIYGESKIEKISKELNIPDLGAIPMENQFAKLVDLGEIERFTGDYLQRAENVLEKMIEQNNIKNERGELN